MIAILRLMLWRLFVRLPVIIGISLSISCWIILFAIVWTAKDIAPGLIIERFGSFFVPTATADQQPIAVEPTPAPSPFRQPVDLPPLRLDDLFQIDPQLPAGIEASKVRALIVTGDVIPARYTNYKLTQRGDFTYPFSATLHILRDAHLSFMNLEAPLMQRCPVQTAGLQFCGDARFVQGLSKAGVDVVGLANNHIRNYGQTGVDETVALLRGAGIAAAGVGEIVYRDAEGIRFAFLAYNAVGETVDRALLRRQVGEAKRNAQIVVVQFHWGREYVSVPERAAGLADDDPRELGRLTIDAGADLVVGNHPHWVQGVELYRDRLIAYAHGNFIFDQAWSDETVQGVIGRYTFYGDRLVTVRYTPVRINDYTQPRVVTGTEGEAIIDRMRKASIELATRPR